MSMACSVSGTGWRVILFAVVAVIVARVAAVAIALLGSGLSRGSTLFMGWFGPRGIGVLVLGLIASRPATSSTAP